MILTVTLNAAIDRTVAVPNFRLGRRHRAVESRTVAGGKGVNVARALKLLGRPVIVTGLAGGGTGSRIKERLTEESILHHFTEIEGESRTNLAVIDPTSGEQTEINERGPEVRPEEIEAVHREAPLPGARGEPVRSCREHPPGVDASVYGRLIADLERLGVPAVLDTDGDPMRLGMRAEPAVVAPNVIEAEEAVGHEFNDSDDLAMGLAGLVEMGAREAVITREAGCFAIVDDGGRHAYQVEIEPLEPVSGVGSGDCFLAGYVAARYEGAAPRECLAYGVACGAESTQHFGAGNLNPHEVDRLLPRVQVTELEIPAGVN